MRWIALLAMSWAQDTVRVMAYNLLYYGSTPGYCNTSCKDRQLRTIVGYIRPHIIGFNEIAPVGGIFSALAGFCAEYWGHYLLAQQPVC